MRLLAKALAVTAATGAAIAFAASTATAQSDTLHIEVDLSANDDGGDSQPASSVTVDADIALLFVSITLGGNAAG